MSQNLDEFYILLDSRSIEHATQIRGLKQSENTMIQKTYPK